MIKGKSQAILGFIFALIATIGLVIGATRIWVWFNANYAKREVSYQQSRLSAARRITSTYASGTTALESEYTKSLNLTEDWVFKGDHGDQSVGYVGSVTEPSREDLLELCQAACLAESGSGCGTAVNFDSTCPCYVKCRCNGNNIPTLSVLQQQAVSLRSQANSLRSAASNLRKVADKCSCTLKHPGRCLRPCSWGRTARELRRGANELDANAAELDAEAGELDTDREKMRECCDFDTEDQQKTCFDLIGQESCEESAGRFQADWRADLAMLEAERAQEMNVIVEINKQVPQCNDFAVAICKSKAMDYANNQCTKCPPIIISPEDCYVNICVSGCTCTQEQWQAYYNAYYPSCFENETNACCKTFCYDGNTGVSCINDAEDDSGEHSCSCWEDQWGTACYAPATDCGLGADDSPQCGLSVYANHLQLKIDNELTPAINALPNKIDNVLACCEKPEITEQMRCVVDLVHEGGA